MTFASWRFRAAWLDVEAALARAQARLGIIPDEAAREITARARVELLDVDRLRSDIAQAVHPIMPLVRALSDRCAAGYGEYVHWEATTQDVLHTGLVLRLRRADARIRGDLDTLVAELRQLATEHRETPMAGRTHGQHAVPITFGYKLAVWVDELQRHLSTLDWIHPEVMVGQFGGATGTLAALGPKGLDVRRELMAELGLGEPAIGWHVVRDRVKHYTFVLTLVASSLQRLAAEIILLQRTEIGELAEPFHSTQVGSSTMPHKRNPVLSEALWTLGEIVKNDTRSSLSSLGSINERDKAVFSVEVDDVPRVCQHVHRMITLAIQIVAGLKVDRDAMLANIALSRGQLFSERVMMHLAGRVGRQQAHDMVCEVSMAANDAGEHLRDALARHPGITALLNPGELDRLFDLSDLSRSAALLVDLVCAGSVDVGGDAVGTGVRPPIPSSGHHPRGSTAGLGRRYGNVYAIGYKPRERSMDFIGEAAAFEHLVAAGLPVVDHVVARDQGSAVTALERLPSPVVAKVASAHVLHKSDFDGVRLGLRTPDDIRAVWEDFDRRHRQQLGEPLPAMVVARMASGVEIFVGARRDPIVGPLMVFGLGGIFVELFREITYEQLPISAADARRMIHATRAGQLLGGFRGAEPANKDALVELMTKVSALVIERRDIHELDLNPIMVDADGATIVDARIGLGPVADVRPTRPARPLPRGFLDAESVAVIGASTDPAKPGGRVVRSLLDHGFAGRIIPVHPKSEEIAGLPAVASLADLDPPADLAVVATPGHTVPDIIRQCHAAGIEAAIVFSAGFAESGPDGEANQQALEEALASTNVRIAGPNCNGIVSPVSGMAASFAGSLDRTDLPAGNLALVSQSGAIGSSLVSRSWDAGIGFSRWISTGNEADLTIADYLDLLADDEHTAAILLFVESVREPDRFRAAALKCLDRKKPVVAYKTGRSTIAQAVIASHTGALAGEDAAYDAFFRRCGIVRVHGLRELVDVGRVLARGKIPAGHRAGVLTMSGGAASVIADAAESHSLELPELDELTQRRLAEDIPSFGSYRNPVDATADAVTNPAITTRALEALCASDQIDLVLVQLTTNADPSAVLIAEAIVKQERTSDLPIIVARAGGDSLATKGLAVYAREGVPMFDYPERLVAAARGAVTYGDLLRAHEARRVALA